MLDIGWTELMVIGVVALIVIGPKDLPDMFRTLGRFTAKARRMAGEFQRAMESAADETGIKDVAKDLKAATSARSMGLDAVKGAAAKFEAWDPMKPAPKAATPPPAKVAAPEALSDTPAHPSTADPGVMVPLPPLPGPATQALIDAKAARSAILADATAALKQANGGSAQLSTSVPPTAKPPGRRRTPSPPVAVPEIFEKKPRAPRKAPAKAEQP